MIDISAIKFSNPSLDRQSDLYKYYLHTQRTDGMGGGGLEYCDFLTKKLLPSTDFAKMKILDVGCRAFYTYDYFKALGNNDIVGVDIGGAGLEYCKQEGKPCFDQDAHFLLERFQPETFDLVMSFHMLEHAFSTITCLKNIYQVLKPGGFFYCAVPSPCGVDPDPRKREGHWTAIESDAAFEGWLVEAGFAQSGRLYSKHHDGSDGTLRGADEYVSLSRK